MKTQLLGIKEIQEISLDILKFVAKICERENFRYCLIYGTLIGAIRHKGYIPWDDDVDIMMPRPDYEKFLAYADSHKEEMGFYEIFNRRKNKHYLYGISRVCDSRYEIYKKDEKNCGMGIFIDIYPYDGLGDDYTSAMDKLRTSRFYCDTIADMTRRNWSIPSSLNMKGKIIYYLSMYLHKMLGVGYYHNKLNTLRENFEFDKSKYVGPLWYFMKPENVCYYHNLFEDFIKVPFEDGLFYVPKEYDKLLTQTYGDYMTPPPIEQRIYHHHYTAYKKGNFNG